MTIQEVAQRLGTTPTVITKLISENRIACRGGEINSLDLSRAMKDDGFLVRLKKIKTEAVATDQLTRDERQKRERLYHELTCARDAGDFSRARALLEMLDEMRV